MSDLTSLIWRTLRDPRGGLRAVLALGLTMQERWLVFALAVVLPTLLIGLLLLAVPVPAEMMLTLSPIGLAISQGLGLGLMVFLAHSVGRMRGGRGDFADTLLTLSWLQIIIVAILMAVMVIEIALPLMATLVALIAIVLILWVLTNFIAELHGFQSLPMTFLGIVVTFIAANFIVALVLAPFLGTPNV